MRYSGRTHPPSLIISTLWSAIKYITQFALCNAQQVRGHPLRAKSNNQTFQHRAPPSIRKRANIKTISIKRYSPDSLPTHRQFPVLYRSCKQLPTAARKYCQTQQRCVWWRCMMQDCYDMDDSKFPSLSVLQDRGHSQSSMKVTTHMMEKYQSISVWMQQRYQHMLSACTVWDFNLRRCFWAILWPTDHQDEAHGHCLVLHRMSLWIVGAVC